MRQGFSVSALLCAGPALAGERVWPKMDPARIELPGLVTTKSRSVVRPMMDLRFSNLPNRRAFLSFVSSPPGFGRFES